MRISLLFFIVIFTLIFIVAIIQVKDMLGISTRTNNTSKAVQWLNLDFKADNIYYIIT